MIGFLIGAILATFITLYFAKKEVRDKVNLSILGLIDRIGKKPEPKKKPNKRIVKPKSKVEPKKQES
jgi:hypothetical protein